VVTSIDGEPAGGRPPSLRFAADGSLSGFTGVNRMFGRYEIRDGVLAVGGAGVTRMAGPPEAMQLESTILAMINAGGAITWSGDTMHIESGGRRLTLRAQTGSESDSASETEPEPAPEREQEPSDDPVVTGTVVYHERIAMPPGAVLTVSLLDVSRADAPADVISRLTNEDPGNVPIRFELPYDEALIDVRHTYSLRATIDVGGELWWTSADAHLVITGGHPSTVDVVLRRVRA
jgi:putative lipoprotein